MTGNAILESLFRRQMETWPEARQRYDGLKEAITKEFNLNGMTVRAQFNPARAVSTLAVTGREATSARPCFLCGSNRPAQQEALPFTGKNGRQYEILVNPFPIFPAAVAKWRFGVSFTPYIINIRFWMRWKSSSNAR